MCACNYEVSTRAPDQLSCDMMHRSRLQQHVTVAAWRSLALLHTISSSCILLLLMCSYAASLARSSGRNPLAALELHIPAATLPPGTGGHHAGDDDDQVAMSQVGVSWGCSSAHGSAKLQQVQCSGPMPCTAAFKGLQNSTWHACTGPRGINNTNCLHMALAASTLACLHLRLSMQQHFLSHVVPSAVLPVVTAVPSAVGFVPMHSCMATFSPEGVVWCV